MKRILLLLTIGAILTVPAFAQQAGSTNAPSHMPPPGGGHMGGPMAALTPEERQELMEARQAAFEADPKLQAELDAVQKKINAAMISADPNVAPIIAKLEAARQQREGGPGGPPPGGNGGNAKTPPSNH